MTTRRPAEAFPPGVFVKEELEELGWSQADLAEVIGRPVGLVNELIVGKRGVSPETAKDLAAAFGTSPELWMNLESSYQLSRVSKDAEGDITRRAKMYQKVPIKDMVRRGWIEHSENVAVLEGRLLRFLQVDNLDEEPKLPKHAARKSTPYFEQATSAQKVWLLRAAQIAKAISVSSYSQKKLDTALNQIQSLLHEPLEARHVPRILAEAGIRFVVVQQLPGTKIDGACFWIDRSPVISMSLRFDRIDNFWFVLMHELGHLSKGESSLDEDMKPTSTDQDRPDWEQEADRFALEHLLPQEKLSKFAARIRPLYSLKRIEAFAQKSNVHPGIVVGQLQYREEVKYSSFRKALVPVREIVIGSATTDGWGTIRPSGL